MSRGRRLAVAVGAAVLTLSVLGFGTRGAAAQAPATEAGNTSPDSAAVGSVSPRGAFLRSLVVPGWGHAAIGSHTRGGFYFVAQSATAYTLFRARERLIDVRERIATREGLLRTQLSAEGVTDPAEIDARLESDPDLQALAVLDDSRGDQQEDMVALGIFLFFLSGADAYVAAHLGGFPEALDVSITSASTSHVELALRIKLPN